jgi:serine-type D-Ala-D-Ala carboxypeptidase/endopeptidase (penicillin-binding protein 4)
MTADTAKQPTAPQRASRSEWRRLASLALVAFLLSAPSQAVDPALRAALERQVRAAGAAVAHLGVHVVDLTTGETVYAHNPDTLMIPASNQKLLTSALALDTLGPRYFFETPVGIQGEVRDGVLHGDLGVRGGGDPTISGRFEAGDSFAVFRRWAQALSERGIREVAGDLYLEHGLFEDEVVHPDWPREQLMWWYEAPVGALSFNDNVVQLRAWGSQPGRPAAVEMVPRLPALRLHNGLVTSGERRQHNVRVHRAPFGRTVEVTGRAYRNARPTEVWVTVLDPVEYFGMALRHALAEEGIEIRGQSLPVERLPGPWWELVTAHRTNLLTALDVINKRSQNFYAESVLKLLGAHLCGEGTWEGGRRAVEQFATSRLGWEPGSFRVADGSGMSRNNRLTPRQLTHLLEHMYGHRYGWEFMVSLPYSGEPEASLSRRLTDPPYRGNVFAKTGTLGGVTALSGYVKGASGTLYAFAIVGNRTSTAEGRRLQDRFLMALIDNG